MNPELMNDIKTRYEGFVATDKGQAHAKKAKEIQAQATALLKQFEKDPLTRTDHHHEGGASRIPTRGSSQGETGKNCADWFE